MAASKKGGDRQQLHEKLRALSKKPGLSKSELVEIISKDVHFNLTKEEIEKLISPENLAGLASIQTTQFLQEHVDPLLQTLPKAAPVEIDI